MSEFFLLPGPPTFSDELKSECRESGDFRPMLFEWYKFTALLCNFYASIHFKSPAFEKPNKLPAIRYAVCIGLLNRCSRLMLSNIALSHTGAFGETTSIIDRSIFESCVKLAWLCQQQDTESLERFLADGLKTELELKTAVEKAIQERNNQTLPIEDRMLTSIQRTITSSTLSEQKIVSAKKLPDLASMLEMLGQSRWFYLVGQKVGSQHVHGSWPSLKLHYLKMGEDGFWSPADHGHETHQNQFIYIPLVLLDAMKSHVNCWFENPSDRLEAVKLFDAVMEEISRIMLEADGSDFEIVSTIE